MYPMGVPATPATTPKPRPMEELREALRQADRKMSDLRNTLDDQARGRRWRAAAGTAKEIARVAEQAEKDDAALDAAQTAAAKKG